MSIQTAPAASPALVPESSDLVNMSAAILALGLSELVMVVKKKRAKASE